VLLLSVLSILVVLDLKLDGADFGGLVDFFRGHLRGQDLEELCAPAGLDRSITGRRRSVSLAVLAG